MVDLFIGEPFLDVCESILSKGSSSPMLFIDIHVGF